MFKKFVGGVVLAVLLGGGVCVAQEGEGGGVAEISQETDLNPPEPRIELRESVRAGERVFIDGSGSVNFYPNVGEMDYEWDLGNGYTSGAKKFQFIYDRPGRYEVSLTLRQVVEEVMDDGGVREVELVATEKREIYVYRAMAVFVMEGGEGDEQEVAVRERAEEENFYIKEVGVEEGLGTVEEQEKLAQALRESAVEVRDAEMLVVWGDVMRGLNALDYFGQQYGDVVDFQTKTIVVLTDGNLGTVARIGESTFLTLNPERIVFTREAAAAEVLEAGGDGEAFLEVLRGRGYERYVIDAETHGVSVLNFMSYLVGEMVRNGVSNQVILYLLMLPVMAVVVAFFRQVIGFVTAGVYVPIFMALAMIFLGFKVGLAVILTVVFASVLVRLVLRKQRLIYTPKVALAFSAVALLTWGVVAVAALGGVAEVRGITVLPILIIVALAEKITVLESGKSLRRILNLYGEILVVAVVCYVVVERWTGLQVVMRAYPELVLLTLVVNYLLGRWTGLRLREYFRFRSLIYEIIEKEEEE